MLIFLVDAIGKDSAREDCYMILPLWHMELCMHEISHILMNFSVVLPTKKMMVGCAAHICTDIFLHH